MQGFNKPFQGNRFQEKMEQPCQESFQDSWKNMKDNKIKVRFRKIGLLIEQESKRVCMSLGKSYQDQFQF